MSLITLAVLVAVLVFSILIHEGGHYLAALWMKIDVEEFGIGFPPKIKRLWRLAGSLKAGELSIFIPANFPGNLSREDLEKRLAVFTLTQDSQQRYVLQSLRLASAEETPSPLTQTGPESWSLTSQITEFRPGTEFTLNAIPLGGFVRPRGENDPSVPGGLAAASPLRRMVVLFAGPLMNLLSALVLFTIIFNRQGLPTPGVVKISEVLEASPAQQAGFQVNDQLIAVNQTRITSVENASQTIRAGVDTPLTFTIQRNAETLTLQATPLSSREAPLGVSLRSPLRKASPGEVLLIAAKQTGVQSVSTFLLPALVMRGIVSPEEARPVGLVGMYSIFGQAIQRDLSTRQQPASTSTDEPPSNWTLILAASISISLGILNLYPIPALDGGRILFALVEWVSRRRLPMMVENYLNGAFFLLLIVLMLVINSYDLISPASITLP